MQRTNDSLAARCWEAIAGAPDEHEAAVAAAAAVLGPSHPERLFVLRVTPDPSHVDVIMASSEGPTTARSRVHLSGLKPILAAAHREPIVRGTRGLLKELSAEGLLGVAVALRASGPISGLAMLAARRYPSSDDIAALRAIAAPLAHGLAMRDRLERLRVLELEKESLVRRLKTDASGDSIVGDHGGLREVVARVRQVAPTDLPVLLLGETGSGKEVIARLVHEQSPRAAAPFHRVNCGAIPSELVDSELFGHERGAFTGAASARQGWFERADRGTLFLDEVGELPAAAQVRLLRVLQDGTFERVGGQSTLRADVRVVAATHRDLQSMTADGRFREDLWYRIAAFQILIPPLRRRSMDLEALTKHFVERASRRFGVPVPGWAAEDLATLGAYRWPGNVREFAAVIDRAVLLAKDGRLDVSAALGTPSAQKTIPPPPPTPIRLHAPPTVEPRTSRRLDDVMVAEIETALRACLGRVEGPFGAAVRLGINPHTLRARMRRFALDASKFRVRM